MNDSFVPEWPKRRWVDRDAIYRGRRVVIEREDDDFYYASYLDNSPIARDFFIDQENPGRGEFIGKIKRGDKDLVFTKWRTWIK